MSHSIYVLILTLTSITGWGAWLLVITRLDPEEITGSFPLVMFYSTLFLAILGTGSILSFYLRRWITKNELFYEHLNSSIREGFLVAFTVITVLWLQYYRVLSIWDAALLGAAMVLLEVFIMSRKKDKHIL